MVSWMCFKVLEHDRPLNEKYTYVVNMFSTNSGCYALALSGTLNAALVSELRLLLN